MIIPGYCPLLLCIPACVAPALTIIWTALDLSTRTSPAPQAWPSSWALLSHWSSLVAQANHQVKMLQYGLQFWVWYPLGKDPTCACLQVHSCWHCAFKVECPLLCVIGIVSAVTSFRPGAPAPCGSQSGVCLHLSSSSVHCPGAPP